ncbi:protein FAM83E [Protopterus annectens]|uniref:protein FAM83E n=1 Tax=Protopterus annectens TaxID=7888 RepID=UPI001CFAF415|nr:protein FAM83E [Protopterus annectens]
MANSQINTLDDDHINMKLTESSPEFYYSEGQRLAMEALLTTGTTAFYNCLQAERIREFLAKEEISRIEASVETYCPVRYLDGEAESDQGPEHSLSYWPVKSDRPTPVLEIGWPVENSWKGITRVTVYTHPPGENAPHIKEIVRRLIQNATQVIAIVMDTFTDPDIFQDVVDAASRRRVAVYMLLAEQNLSSFLHMADKQGIKLLYTEKMRVRVIAGCTFCSRTLKKVTGTVKEKFLLIDSQSVVTGTYSFTWSDSRLDRNLVTHLTGQIVDSFDHEFRTLYALSRPLLNADFLAATEHSGSVPKIVLSGPVPATVAEPGLTIATVAPTRNTGSAKYQLVQSNGYSSPLKFSTPGKTQPVDILPSSPYIAIQHEAPNSKVISLNKVTERRAVPPPAVKSGAPVGAYIKQAMTPSQNQGYQPPIIVRETFNLPDYSARHGVVTCRNFEGPASQLRTPEVHSALSDILKNVQKSKLSVAKTTGAKASRSLWDLSKISQMSASSEEEEYSNGDVSDSGDDKQPKARHKPNDTPAKTLMKHRFATHNNEEVRVRVEPTVYPPMYKPSSTFSALRLKGQLYNRITSSMMPRPWGNSSAQENKKQIQK